MLATIFRIIKTGCNLPTSDIERIVKDKRVAEIQLYLLLRGCFAEDLDDADILAQHQAFERSLNCNVWLIRN
jgi:hypothetical protein